VTAETGYPGPRTESRREGPEPEVLTLYLLLTLAVSVCFVAYLKYEADSRGAQFVYSPLLAGAEYAPEQYRIGVVYLGHRMALLTGLPMRITLSLIDLTCSTGALLLVYRSLRKRMFYRNGPLALRWISSLALAAGATYFLAWAPWYNRPTTMTIIFLTMCVASLWARTNAGGEVSRGSQIWRGAALLGCTVLLCTVRADLALILGIAFLGVATTPRGAGLALKRTPAMVVAAWQALVALVAQWMLIHVFFPRAVYRSDTRILEILQVRINPFTIFPFELIAIPVVWMCVAVSRRRTRLGAQDLGLFAASLLYLPAITLFGAPAEVRIYIPVMIALLPLMVELVAERIVLRGGATAA
jgi:hypothetical protein